MKKQFTLFLIAFFVLWFFAVFSSFYLVQKPFTPAAAAAVVKTLLDLLTAGWIGLLGLGLGRRLLSWLLQLSPFKPNVEGDLSTGEVLILGSGLGLGVLGLLTLGLGLAGLFYPWLFIGMSVVLTLLLWSDWLTLYRRLRHSSPLEDHPGRLVVFYIIILIFFTLTIALLPPVDWDGLFYHLAAPKIFIKTHQISPGINIPHFNFPFLAEMLFTYAMLLRGDIAAKLIHTLFGLLLTGLVYLTARRYLNRQSAWPAALILLSMPMMTTLAGWAYNDLALAFYQLAAVYALLRFTIPPPPNPRPLTRWLILSGIFAGLAMGLKYTSFVCPLTISLVLIWRQGAGSWCRRLVNLRDKQAKRVCEVSRLSETTDQPSIHHASPPFTTLRGHSPFLLPLLSFILPALLVAIPWYLKNFFFTGNPFYPFLSDFFDGLFWDRFRSDWYAQAGTGIGFNLVTLLGLPVLVTLGVQDVNYFDGRTGPLFLAFFPFILLYGVFRYWRPVEDHARYSERPPALDILLIFVLVQFFFWMLGVFWSRSLWQSRLLLPGLAALSPVVGWLWQDLSHLKQSRFSLYRFTNLLIGLALTLNIIELTLNFVQINPLAYLTGQETRDEYLTRRLGAYYATMEQLNQTLPSTAVVLFLWEPRSYFCQVECRPDTILDQLAHDHYLYGEAAQIAQAWRKAGVTHILLHRQGLDFFQSEDTEASYKSTLEQLAVLQARYFKPVFDVVGAYQLYELRKEN